MLLKQIFIINLLVSLISSLVLEVDVDGYSEDFIVCEIRNICCVYGQDIGLLTNWQDLL